MKRFLQYCSFNFALETDSDQPDNISSKDIRASLEKKLKELTDEELRLLIEFHETEDNNEI